MSVIFEPLTGQLLQIPSLVFPGTLVIASGKTFTVNNTLTLAGTDGTTMTFPSTSATLARTDADSLFAASQSLTKTINATSADGLVLANATAAAVGAQQWSPRLRLTGQGWKTTVTAASQTVDWIVENQPVQGTTAPTTTLAWSYQVNGGGYASMLTLSNSGLIVMRHPTGSVGTDELQFTPSKSGVVNASIYAGAENLFIGTSSGKGVYLGSTSGQGPAVFITGATFGIPNGWTLSFTNGNAGDTIESTLVRDSTGVIGLRKASIAQNFRIYNTFTTVNTAGEWFKQDWITTANQFRFGAAKGSSTGTARVASWDYGGTEASPSAAISVPITSGAMTFGGGVLFGTDNSFDIGATGSGRPQDVFIGRNVTLGQTLTTVALTFSLGATFISQSSGTLRLTDIAGTDFGRLMLGGTTSSYPALKRSGAKLQARLADDSAAGTFEGKYNSSDATAGATAGPFTVITAITVKDGLVTSLTGS